MELPEIVNEEEWERANDDAARQGEGGDPGARRARRRAPAPADGRDLAPTTSSTGRTGGCGCPTCSRAGRSCSLYHFWHPPEGEPCGGCSMFTDQVSRARAPATPATPPSLSSRPRRSRRSRRSSERMGWELPWYTAVGDEFQTDARDDRVLQARRLRPRRRPRLPHLRDPRPRRRGARQRLDLPRPDAVRAPGGVGGHAGGPPAGAAVSAGGVTTTSTRPPRRGPILSPPMSAPSRSRSCWRWRRPPGRPCGSPCAPAGRPQTTFFIFFFFFLNLLNQPAGEALGDPVEEAARPCAARSYSSGGRARAGSKRISVRPSPRSVRTTVTSACLLVRTVGDREDEPLWLARPPGTRPSSGSRAARAGEHRRPPFAAPPTSIETVVERAPRNRCRRTSRRRARARSTRARRARAALRRRG